MKISDKILLYRIQGKKDPDAYAQLYDRYIERIYRFVFLKISHKQEAEDVTSEIFLKTWNYLIDSQDRQIKSFSGLIYQIARNRIVDWYRDQAKSDTTTIDEAERVADDFELEHAVAQKQSSEDLLGQIKKLKQEYQEIILLRYIEELSIAEIAEILGKKRTAVRVTLHRAIKKLKDISLP